MLKRIGNDDAYIDPDMIAMIAPREGGGVRVFMKTEGGGAVINLTEGTVKGTYDYLFPKPEPAKLPLDPTPYVFQGRRYATAGEPNSRVGWGDRAFRPEDGFSKVYEDYV